ncbi:phage tail sheath family protein, partial [Escherichia coli]|nr:phage tail sheath family protein [Escherichia coli]
MAANYLHGVETIEIETGPRPVKAVKSAVIALIGTAPCGPVNKPTLCLSESDAAQFGSTQANFTIPQALKAIYDHGAGTVVVINVLDPAKHGSNISNESITFDANNQAKLAHRNVRNVVLKPSSSNSSTFNTAAFSVDEQTG